MEINEERARYWLSMGAQPSDAVARLLQKKGVIAERKLRQNRPSAPKTEEKPAPTPAGA